MIHTPQRLVHLLLCFLLLLEQPVFAQTIDLSQQLSGLLTHSSTTLRASSAGPTTQDTKFRPLHLRSISYDSHNNDFKLLLDKGDTKLYNSPNSLNSLNSLNSPNSQNSLTPELQNSTQELLKYFFIGLSLPNDKFWVNLRPDAPDNIIDDDVAKTDIGKIFLEADVQLKKDTSNFTSPQTKEGKEYWDKLYKKAEELLGKTENITIPTLTRPWIVPNEIIIRESPESAYIYKATLKVMLEEDYLETHTPAVWNPHRGGVGSGYNFFDPRLKELNEYSTKLIKEAIIPKLTYAVNTSKRYAPLRQVYYSLILAQWFKARYRSAQLTVNPSTVLGAGSGQLTAQTNPYLRLIDSKDLTNLISKESYSKQTYFQQYQKSFKDGEYNLQEPIYTPYGQSIRRYMSGGIQWTIQKATETIVAKASGGFIKNILVKMLPFILISGLYMPSAFGYYVTTYEGFHKPHFYMGTISTDKNLVDQLRSIAWGKGVEITDEELKELILLVKKNNPGKDFTRDNIDVTSVFWWSRLKSSLSAGDIVLKQTLPLNGQEAILYLLEAEGTFAGETVGNKIIINLESVRKQIKLIQQKIGSPDGYDKEFFQKIYSGVSKKQLAMSEVGDIAYHEAIHTLTEKAIGSGKINREYMESIFKKYNIPEDSKYEVTLELVAYLGQLSKSKFPKRLLWEYCVQTGQKQEKYKTCFEIITGELLKMKLGYSGGINHNDRMDFIISLSDPRTGQFSAERYYEIMGIMPPEPDFLPSFDYVVKEYSDDAKLTPIPLLRNNKSGSSPIQESSASSAVEDTLAIQSRAVSSPADKKGGIAFNALPIQTQAIPGVSSAAKFITHNSQFITSSKDLDSEWSQIQAMMNANIRPSIDRLKTYTIQLCSSPMYNQQIDEVRVLVSELLRKEEYDEKQPKTEKSLTELVVALESAETLDKL